MSERVRIVCRSIPYGYPHAAELGDLFDASFEIKEYLKNNYEMERKDFYFAGDIIFEEGDSIYNPSDDEELLKLAKGRKVNQYDINYIDNKKRSGGDFIIFSADYGCFPKKDSWNNPFDFNMMVTLKEFSGGRQKYGILDLIFDSNKSLEHQGFIQFQTIRDDIIHFLKKGEFPNDKEIINPFDYNIPIIDNTIKNV